MEHVGRDRRRFLRAGFPCKIIVSSIDKALTSHTEDISKGGIRVLLEEKLSYLETVSLSIFCRKDVPIRCEGRVVWIIERVNPVEGKPVMFDTGIAFMKIKDSDREYIGTIVEALKEQQQLSEE